MKRKLTQQLFALLICLGAMQGAWATHYSVTTLNGSAPGSLTWAITQVDSNHTSTISNPDVIDICTGGSTGLNGLPIHSCVFNCPKDMSLTIAGIYFTLGGRSLAGIRVTFNNAVFDGNSGSAFGSAFMGSSNACYIFNNCLFSNNDALYQSGAIFMNGDSAFINGCTFYNNSTTNNGGQGGAAVYNNGGYISLSNCTFVNNTSVTLVSGTGGGAVVNDGNMDVVNCTFYGNHAASDGGALCSKASAGFCNLTNCIFVGNTADSAGSNLWGAFASNGGYNLFQDTTGAAIGSVTTGNIYTAVTSAVLDTVLRNNGDYQLTLALKAGGPAVNAGTVSGAPATDQRGYGRNGAPDMGAFEYQGVNGCAGFSTVINPVVGQCAPDTFTLSSVTTGGTMIADANWFDGTNYFCATQIRVFSSGTYTYTTTDTNNCTAKDSIVISVRQPSTSNINATICTGETFTVGTHVYNSTGNTTDTLIGASSHGCDSIVILNLTVNPVPTISISRSLYGPDVTVPYVQAFGASSNSTYDINNLPQNAFDHDTAIFGWGANSGNANDYLQYDYGAGNARVLTSYGIYLSAQQMGGWGSLQYSPAHWTFQGTNDTTWHTLDSIHGNALKLDTLYTYNFTNTTAYRKYRINITATGSGNYPHITEFYLAGADSVEPVSNITADSYYGGNPPEAAFDDDTTVNGWANAGNNLPAWLQYDFGSGNRTVVNAYTIYNSCGMVGGWCNASYNPVSWKFEGSNDTVWTLLDTIANGHIVIGSRSVFPISNTTAYQKYRITITYTTDGSYARITEMEFLQSESPCGGSVFAANVNNTSPAAKLQWKVNGTNAGTGVSIQTFGTLHAGDSVSCVLTDSNACQRVITLRSNSLVYVTGSSDTASLTVCKDSIVINGIRVSQSGTYRDTVVNRHGCDSINTYILTVHNCGSNGINEIGDLGFKLVPNPNNGLFTLEFGDNADRDIQILNLLGTVVREFESRLQQVQVDLSSQAAGLYIISVKQNGQQKQVRFVIDK